MRGPTASQLIIAVRVGGFNLGTESAEEVLAFRVEKVLSIRKPTGSDRSDELLDEIVRILDGEE